MSGAIERYDLAVVGAGIVGLAHALAAARLGLKTIVVDRDAQANGASVRNFGFITVTGQQKGECHARAKRSRDVWLEVAPRAEIRVEHRGLIVLARRPEAADVLEAFVRTEMGEGCRFLPPARALDLFPMLKPEACAGALWSAHEIRVESREAVPLLARFLGEAQGVTFLRNTLVRGVGDGVLDTTSGPVHADRVVVAPNDDFLSLYPERIEAYRLTKCKLHMLRAELPDRVALPAAVMSDLSLVRYLGYAELPEAGALAARLKREQPDHLANGVHLIAVQSADGSLVIGDSHHYRPTPDPFAPELVDALILDEFRATFGSVPHVIERWTGIYPSATDRLMLIDEPAEHVRLVIVTSGTGASTAFAIAEEVIGDLFAETVADKPLPE